MNHPIQHIDHVLKRMLDVIGATTGLVVLSPVLIAVGIAVKLYDGGPIFYRATRVGKDGTLFRVYKFRTMVVDAHRRGPGITALADPRITPVGRWLRRTKLDELPQLINVLKGEMSLVGPRPEDPRYVALYTVEQRRILMVRPGITSAASLAYRYEEQLLAGPEWEALYRCKVMPEKLTIDLHYLSRRTLWTDVCLILKTLGTVFK